MYLVSYPAIYRNNFLTLSSAKGTLGTKIVEGTEQNVQPPPNTPLHNPHGLQRADPTTPPGGAEDGIPLGEARWLKNGHETEPLLGLSQR